MPPKTALKKGESLQERRGKRGGASTTEDILDVVVTTMQEETSRLQKAPTKKGAAAGEEKAKRANKTAQEEPTIPKKKIGRSASAIVPKKVTKDDEESDVEVEMNGGKPKAAKIKKTVGRSTSVRVPKVTKGDKTAMEVTENGGKSKKGFPIALRGRRPKGGEAKNKPDAVLEEEEDSSVVVLKAVDGKTAKALAMKNKRDNTAQLENDTVELDATVEETQFDESVQQAASDTNNNKKGAKRKINEAVKRTASVKLQKVSPQPIHDRGVGNAYTFGKGDMGQLGLGEDVLKRNYPSLVDELSSVKFLQVVAGGLHSVALDETGTVWTFGCNDDKALGRQTVEEEENFVPGKVNLPKKIIQVSAGDSHSAALTEEGDVYAWGTFKDSNGNIGLVPGEGEMCRVNAELVSSTLPSKVKKICSGDHHLVMLTTDGKIFTCGNGEMGQLGRNCEAEIKRVTRASTTKATATGPSKTDIMLTPGVIASRSRFTDIWTGSFATYGAIVTRKPTSDIYVFGLNSQGQLGIKPQGTESVVEFPTKSSGFSGKKWKQIAGGQHHAVALDDEGHVFSLGRGDDGRLGLGEDDSSDKHEPTLVPGIKDQDFVQVSAGLSTAYAISSDGTLYSWGCGVNFQLGNGSADEAYDPIKIEHMVEEKKKLDLKGKVKFISGGGQHVVLTLSKDLPQESMEID